MRDILILIAIAISATSSTASCLKRLCQEELTQCSIRDDCGILFKCVGKGDCEKIFAVDSTIGRCLTHCGNSTALVERPDEISLSFQKFWDARNAIADKHLRSFKPTMVDFSFPSLKTDESGADLRRRLLSNTKKRLSDVAEKMTNIVRRSSTTALIEKHAFQ